MRILFVCTHNRCRSILAEALANHFGRGYISAASAGSNASKEVHPLTMLALKSRGISVDGLHSKSWYDLEEFMPEVVITVCDNAAGEACPLWLGDALKIHWGLADPSTIEGDIDKKLVAFDITMNTLSQRLLGLAELLESDPGNDCVREYLKSWQEVKTE